MWRGLYTAASGMIAETHRTDTIANNLANSGTAGFKKDVAISKEFEPMLIRRINDDDPRTKVTSFKGFHLGSKAPAVGTLGLGSAIAEVAPDHEQGAFQTTGNPLDVAISGDGYFGVQTPQGIRYTRDGSFYRAASGQLQTRKGQPVLNTQGRPIAIPPDATSISIGADGSITSEGQQIGRLMLVSFGDNYRAMRKQGDNLWVPQEGAEPRPAAGEIQQGCLERSNSNVVTEMVNLIANQRIYEAGSKAVVTQDAMLEKSVTEVGAAR